MAKKGKGMDGYSYKVPAEKLKKIEDSSAKMGYIQKLGAGRMSPGKMGDMTAAKMAHEDSASKYYDGAGMYMNGAPKYEGASKSYVGPMAHGPGGSHPDLKEFIGTGNKTSFKKDDIKKVIESQKQYDQNTTNITRNLAEIDSLKREETGRGDSAKHFYGYNYTSDMPVPTGERNRPLKNKSGQNVTTPNLTESIESRKKNLERLREQARKMQGPRPTI